MSKFQMIKRLVSSSLDELIEHLMQDTVNSIHIRNIKNNLSEIKSLIDEKTALPSIDASAATRSPKRNVQRGANNKANKEDILRMAYALSKYDYYFFNNMFGTSLNQNKVFEMISAIFGVKASTLRNYRDAFDSHVQQVNSNRTGRVAEKLPQDFQQVKDVCNDKTEDELTQEIGRILHDINPDIELLIKVAFAFLLLTKSIRSTIRMELVDKEFDVIIAPYPDRVAYMVFTSFGNVLANGIYPAIYVYRKFGKVFTVFGESETNAPADTWNAVSKGYKKIREYFTADELLEISTYQNTYLDNYAYNVYELDNDSAGYGAYILELAQVIVTDLKFLVEKYVAHYPASSGIPKE